MEKEELEFAISMMIRDVNIFSRYLEKARAKNLTMIEHDYCSRIMGIDRALIHLGWKLEEEERRTDCKDVEAIEYTHYRAIER